MVTGKTGNLDKLSGECVLRPEHGKEKSKKKRNFF
jgi:hypothetical protein